MYFLYLSVVALVARLVSGSVVTAAVPSPVRGTDQAWDASLGKCINNPPKTVTMADSPTVENITCLPDQRWNPTLQACVDTVQKISTPQADQIPIMSDHDLDSRQTGCSSGLVCADYGSCITDCHTAGCPGDYRCGPDGLCYTHPPWRINQCNDDQHYDPSLQKCINNPPVKLVDCEQLGCASGQICTTAGHRVTDCHIVGCSSGRVRAADGICQRSPSAKANICGDGQHFDQFTQKCVDNFAHTPIPLFASDCRVNGCPGDSTCVNCICLPPANLQMCGSDQHATEHGCVNNGPKALEHVMASMPQVAKSPVLAVDAVCHISLNGATRCCTRTGGICITGEVEKSDDHVIIPIKDEL